MIYNKNEQAIIYFTSFDLSYKKQEEIFSLSSNLFDLIDNFNNYSADIEKIVNDKKVFDSICINLTNGYLSSYLNNLNKKGIVCVTSVSDVFPESLKEIDQPPYILYCKGNINLFSSDCIAIVGTRTPTTYGKTISEQFAKGLTLNNFTIVSGLAAGVDSVAHKTALDNNGNTIAVLGGGFEHIYPAMNKELARKIAEKGLLITEYSPSVKPALYTFPFRNRIISGLSLGVLITEAGEKSGALHTKEYALETGKDIFVVPGNVNSLMSKGTNRLIQTLQGACVLNFEDIVTKYRQKVVKQKAQAIKGQLTMEEELILNALKLEKKSYEQLVEITKLPINKLNSYLTMFEIKGIIKKLPGNMVERV